jgi:hypothetical protein
MNDPNLLKLFPERSHCIFARRLAQVDECFGSFDGWLDQRRS